MSRNKRLETRQAEREATTARPRKLTVLQQTALLLAVAIVGGIVLLAVSSAEAEESDITVPPPTEEVVIGEALLPEAPVIDEATEDTVGEATLRERWSTALDYLVKGDAKAILEQKDSELSELAQSLQKERADLTEFELRLTEWNAGLAESETVLKAQQDGYQAKIAALMGCVGSAIEED